MSMEDTTSPISSPRPSWRAPESYRHLGSLDRAGWAWEWLRRNPEFDAVWRRRPSFEGGVVEGGGMVRTIAPRRIDHFAPWGLLFRRDHRGRPDNLLERRVRSGGALRLRRTR